MLRVAIKGLLGRKVRVALTVLAVVLGVAMMSGTFILTDTVTKAFDEIFVSSLEETSVVVSGKQVVEGAASGPATIQAGLLARVRQLAEVEAAAGEIEDEATIVGKDGQPVETLGPPALGIGLDFAQPRFFSWRLTAGRWPRNRGEVALDQATAADEQFSVGDAVGIATQGPTRKLRVTGIARFGDLDSLGGATAALFTVPAAQELFGKRGRLDTIRVAAKDDVSQEQLAGLIRPLLPSTAQVKTAEEQAQSDSAQTAEGIGLLRTILLAFAGVSLFVGAFVIFNTFSITVAQRTREFATLRTLGALRRQVLTSVILETAIVGLIAAAIGLIAGLALAEGLTALFNQVGLDLPQTGTVFAARTVVVGLVVGTVVAVLAGLAPALRATRVPPIAAVREGAVLPPSRLAPFVPAIAALLTVAAVAMLAYGMFVSSDTTQRLLFLAVGCILLFTGTAFLASRIVQPLAALFGAPAQWLGGLSGRLARDNTTRAPGRTAATAAALMIGLALVTFVASLGQGLRTSIRASVNEQVQAEFVVASESGFEPFPARAGDAVARAAIVEVASNLRGEAAKIAGTDGTVSGVDPATIGTVFRFDWAEGSDDLLRRLGSTGAILVDTIAEDQGLRVGGALRVVTPAGKTLALRVRGLVKAPPLGGGLTGDAIISQAAFDAGFPSPRNLSTFVNVRGEPTAEAEAALARALEPFPDAKVQSRADFVESQLATLGTLLNLLYVLLALSVIVSLFGMVNTLALSIVERTRELGMLRAIGMSRRQTRRMVRHESVITALIGAVLGMPLGIFLALLVSLALEDEGIGFSIPVGSLAVFAAAAFLAGVIAAILPARRAARLNILDALKYE